MTFRQELPKELIIEILARLPAKSLLRFRCASKSFYSLIDSPYFIDLHLHTCARNGTQIKLVFSTQDGLLSTNYNSAKLHVSNFDHAPKQTGRRFLGVNFDHAPKQTWRGLGFLVVNSCCNGIFLLVVNNIKFVLWNPSTQKHKILPSFPVETETGIGSCPFFLFGKGLGYDSTHNEYKIVLIVNVEDLGRLQGFQVWIFGFKSNSWRRVQTEFFPIGAIFVSSGYFAYGYLHWLCYLNDSDSMPSIVAFDVANETFFIVPLPPESCFMPRSLLHVLDGCLCISFLTFSSDQKKALLYVRKKNGADFTWSKLYSVATPQLPQFLKIDRFNYVKVLGYSKEGDKIMLDFDLKYMIFYDLKERSFQTTTILSRISDQIGFLEPCSESLVRL